MNNEYNTTIANHYRAYRPPLHRLILEKVLPTDSSFSMGLDVGCGTGYSSIALARYCTNVIGIDPSEWMLKQAEKDPKVQYMEGSGENVPLPDHTVEITTFAGSLFYTSLNRVSSEIKRVSKKRALIIAYDFQIHLRKILQMFELTGLPSTDDYDHSINFSGVPGFSEVLVGQDQFRLECTGLELAHLLLSELRLLKKFQERFQTKTPFEDVNSFLNQAGNHFFLDVSLYYSKYQLQS